MGHDAVEGGISDIMELEELDGDGGGGEDITKVVAAPPRVAGTRMQTLQELNQAALADLPSSADASIDLGVLTRNLVPRDECGEVDAPWEVSQLLNRVASELLNEEESRRDSEEGNVTSDGLV